jgi:hypothetical protein
LTSTGEQEENRRGLNPDMHAMHAVFPEITAKIKHCLADVTDPRRRMR